MTKPTTRLLLSADVYKVAILSAEAKDTTKKDYKTLQYDRSWTLIYNPTTEDGMFCNKLEAMTYWASGYYEVFPRAGYSQTLKQNIDKINSDGWPVIGGI